jgi:hypothetical protein
MTKLSAEAYAIVEGRHSDPFHYLGLHTEDNKTVVRAFLPEASRVDAIGEYGEAAAPEQGTSYPGSPSKSPGGWSILWRDEDADRWSSPR